MGKEHSYFLLQRKKVMGYGLLFFLLLFLLVLISLAFGSSGYIPVSSLFNEGKNRIILEIRIYRTIAGVLVGIILGLAGLHLQNILRNPLVDPYIIGVSAGGLLGSLVGVLLGFLFGPYSIVLFSFSGALLALFLTYSIGKFSGFSEIGIVLGGVIVSILFSSISVILFFLFPEKLRGGFAWFFGSLSLSTRLAVILQIIGVLPLLAFSFARIGWMRNYIVGNEYALSKGTNIFRLRRETLLIVAWSVSTTTSTVGPIGFLGLIAPHIARMIVGGDIGFSLLLALLLSPTLLLGADVVMRIIFSPLELPVGIITSIIGAPVFLYLLIKTYR